MYIAYFDETGDDGFPTYSSELFVLTSIYGREHSTCYAKPIKDGKSPYPLSVEEMQAIDRAIKGENINY